VKVSLSAHSARRVPLGHDPIFPPVKAQLGVSLLPRLTKVQNVHTRGHILESIKTRGGLIQAREHILK